LGKEAEVFARPWTKYLEWAKKYGNIIYFKLFNGDQIIVLHTKADALELLDKRSVTYSSRPKAVVTDLMGWDFNTTMIPYGTEWRAHRKLYQQCFRPKATLAYAPIQTEKTHAMLKALLETPEDFRAHCRTATTGTLMSLLYGRELTPETIEYFAHMVDEATSKLMDTLIPGTNSPNLVPFLQYLPSWFPGAEFKRAALGVRQLTQQMVEAPIDFVGQGLLEGTSSPSLVSDLLENCYAERDYQRIKKVAATTYSGKSNLIFPMKQS
jgi:cytochrome P450